PIQGVGSLGGFSFQVLDQSGGPITGLADTVRDLVGRGNRSGKLTQLFTSFTANDPQLLLRIDRERVKALGLNLADVTETLQILMGSRYVNDFDFNSRSYRVYVQADQ